MCGGHPAIAHIGAFVVVGPEPLGGNLLHLVDGFKDMEVQPFMPDRPVVALDVSVLLRLSGLDMGQGDASVLSPFHQGAADVFCPVTPSE